MVDDQNIPIHLPFTSPARLKKFLKSSVLRELEIEAGVKCSDGGRLWFDAVEAALASSKFSRKEN
eukprot:7041050-Pyramimonas_sp.AAC.1